MSDPQQQQQQQQVGGAPMAATTSAGGAAAATAATSDGAAPTTTSSQQQQQQQDKKATLAAWKTGADRMATAAAGDQVARAAAPKLQQQQQQQLDKKKAQASAAASKAARRAARLAAETAKPWEQRSIEERYGATPKQVTLAKQLKDVLRYLEAVQERGVITWEELVTRAIPPWYDTAEGGDLFNLLTLNERVAASARGFAYRSEHGVADKHGLLRYVRAHPEGVRASDIKDGYENVLRDADALHAEGLLYRFHNTEFRVDVYFAVPSPPEAKPPGDDLLEAYVRTPLPADPSDLAAQLGKLGVRSALAGAVSARKPVALMRQERPKKRQKRLNLRHVTNTHMLEVLKEHANATIDG